MFALKLQAGTVRALPNICLAKGHKVSVVNPARTKFYAQSIGVRSKGDKSDSKAIAAFCKAHNPKGWKPQTKETRDLKDLIRCLESLKDDRGRILNRLQNQTKHSGSKKALEMVVDSLDQQIETTENLIKDHIKNNPDLKDKFDKLVEIKGVGFLTAVTMLGEMPPAENFENGKQYAAFAGLSPKHYQSGSSILRKSTICKAGSKRVRKALYMPAILVKRYIWSL